MIQSNKSISALRQRMIDDMTMRKLSSKTQVGYIRAVKNLTQFLGRSPDTATAEDLRRFQLHLVNNGTSRTTLIATITGLRLFFEVTLSRPDALTKMSHVYEPRKLPVVLSLSSTWRAKSSWGKYPWTTYLYSPQSPLRYGARCSIYRP